MVGLGRLADESNATRGARDHGGRGSANPPKCEKGAFGAEMSEVAGPGSGARSRPAFAPQGGRAGDNFSLDKIA